jgi:hypothetical protein
MEMWDDAATLSASMKPGELWSLGNARMMIGGSGFLQGKFVEAVKASKLVESDAETNPHLKALLEYVRLCCI